MEVLRNARCANCDTRLDGPFCHNCGQREEPRVPTVRSVLGEVINALFGLESKLWRSMFVLIAKPGQLTQEFLNGKRQKYTTPFRLYLLLSIIVFAYMAYSGSGINVNFNEDAQEVSETIEGDGTQPPEKSSTGNINLNAENLSIHLGFLNEEDERAVEDQLKQSLQRIEDDIKAGQLQKVISHMLEPLPKALLIFLPIVALLFKILFLGRGKYYLEHLVYLLHNHAFLFLVILFSFGLQELKDLSPGLQKPTGWVAIFVWLVYVPVYLYKSLRRVYETSRFATLIYGFLIFMSYLFMMTLMLAFSMIFAGYTYS